MVGPSPLARTGRTSFRNAPGGGRAEHESESLCGVPFRDGPTWRLAAKGLRYTLVMPSSRVSRRRFYAALFCDALDATSRDMGGKGLVRGLVISIGTGLVYLVLTGNQDNPVLGVAAVLVPALVLLIVVFLIHLVLAPARLHQRTLDSWKESTDSIMDSWKEDNASTIDGWKKSNASTIDAWKDANEATLDEWKKSNDSVGYAIRNLTLLRQIETAKGLREHLAASERAAATDDGELQAMVDSWDGRSARVVQGISETEGEFYLRDSAVPKTPGKTWQGGLRDFVLIREDRLKEIDGRYQDRKPDGPVT